MDAGIIVIAGVRGSGKTHRIRELIIRNVARGRTVVCFDPSGDIYGGLRKHYDNPQDPAEADRHVCQFQSVNDYSRASAKGRIIPRVSCVTPPRAKDFVDQASQFRDLVLDGAKSKIVWVSDEAELVFNDWGERSSVFPLVILARNFGGLIVVACKDPVRVSVDLRRNADAALVFALTTREACLALRDIVNPDLVLRAQSLRKRQFIYVAPITEESTRSDGVILGPTDDLPDEL